MKTSTEIAYVLIGRVIELIKAEEKATIHLDQIAAAVGMTYTELDHLFIDWGGMSLQQFLKSISQERIHSFLTGEATTSLFELHESAPEPAPYLAHASFVKIIHLTQEESGIYGENLQIHYQFDESPFGLLITASTDKGVCYMAFDPNEEVAVINMKKRFSRACFYPGETELQQNAVAIFQGDWRHKPTIYLHLRGTEFQIRVWQELLKVPLGTLTTYAKIAEGIGRPDAPRATGTAIGRNPIAYIIPCHRIIQSGGNIGKYMWGNSRKLALIGWEAAKQGMF